MKSLKNVFAVLTVLAVFASCKSDCQKCTVLLVKETICLDDFNGDQAEYDAAIAAFEILGDCR